MNAVEKEQSSITVSIDGLVNDDVEKSHASYNPLGDRQMHQTEFEKDHYMDKHRNILPNIDHKKPVNVTQQMIGGNFKFSRN